MTRHHFKFACFAVLLCCPANAIAQTLGAAQDFAIVAGSAITAAVGAVPSQVVGDVGLSPGTSITGFPPALGAVVVPPYILHVPNDGPSVAAQSAVTALYTSLSSAGGSATTIPDQLAGQNLGPGTYRIGAANLASGGIFRLSGNGIYIFRVTSSLVTISTSNMLLLAGAQACNVWWQVGSSATIGGTSFAGNVVALTGTSSMGPNAVLNGRMLTTTPGAVTLSGANTINAAFCAAPPAGAVGISKAFNPAVIGAGGVSALTVTLANQNVTTATLTALLLDTLPAGVVIAATPGASTTCGGGAVVTAVAGAGSFTLSAGSTIPGGTPGGSCTITVNTTAAAVGTYTNTIPIGALQTSNGNNTVPAVALLIVTAIPPVPTLSEWATIMMAVLLCLTAIVALRQRRRLIGN